MLEHMKVQTTGEFADIPIQVPTAHASRVCAVIKTVLAFIPAMRMGEKPRKTCFLLRKWYFPICSLGIFSGG